MTAYENLYEFQRKAVDYLKAQPSRLICDQMGLGKTWTAIGLDEANRQGPISSTQFIPEVPYKTLVLCRLSVSDMWAEKFTQLTGLRVSVCDPRDREAFLAVDADVYIMHKQVLRKLVLLLKKVRWFHIIDDECQDAQNRKSQYTTSKKQLKATFKTDLSGTPFTNTPDKFWSILHWLRKDKFGSYWRFRKEFCVVDTDIWGYEHISDTKNEQKLLRQIAPFYVRRLKKDVAKELPPKYYSTRVVELAPNQRRVYEEMRKRMLAWVGDREDQMLPAPVVVAQLTRLQQFALAYAELVPKKVTHRDGSTEIVDEVHLKRPSSKADEFVSIVEDAPDKSFVGFSTSKKMVNLVSAELSRKGIDHGVFTGDTPGHLKTQIVEDFQRGKIRIFLGTIQAGGVAITLHRGDTVVFLDRSWSPSENEQAEDRLHRIGQINPVHVIDIVARDTLDQGRFQRLERKSGWLRKMLGDQ